MKIAEIPSRRVIRTRSQDGLPHSSQSDKDRASAEGAPAKDQEHLHRPRANAAHLGEPLDDLGVVIFRIAAWVGRFLPACARQVLQCARFVAGDTRRPQNLVGVSSSSCGVGLPP